MATVTGLTAARMLAIEAASIVDGAVDLSGDLILTTQGGADINAGSVVGPTGAGLNGTVIAETTNLNTIGNPGAYVQLVDAWATTARNYPWPAGVGGWLTVAGTSGGVLLQTYYAADDVETPAIYVRESSNSGSSWTTWRSVILSDSNGNYRFIRDGYDENVRITAMGNIDAYDLLDQVAPGAPARSLSLNYQSGGHVQIGKPGVTTRNIYLNMPVDAKEDVIAEKSIFLSTDTTAVGYWLGNGGVFRSGGTTGGAMIQRAGDTGNYIFVTDDGAPQARIPSAYSRTTGSAANVFVSSTGTLSRSTSLRAAKLDIQDAPEDWAEKVLLLKPRTWIDKANVERYTAYLERELQGEEVDWSDVDVQQIDVRIPGFIAEEVEEAGLGVFNMYDADGELNGVAYDRIAAGLLKVVLNQQKQIDELKALVLNREV